MSRPAEAFYSDDWLSIFEGDCRAVLRDMEPESVHCVVTSPPYWGLRDYGTAGQLGLESTPEQYVAAMVDVFREVRRVLRADGTVWLNLGDSYATSNPVGRRDADRPFGRDQTQDGSFSLNVRHETGLKPKDLVGIPWRVAFALQADGWYLRSDIIWSKPNPMPESVTDRPTKSHEFLFLLSKSARYFYDAAAVAETAIRAGDIPMGGGGYEGDGANDGRTRKGFAIAATKPVALTRNLRSVWTIATAPYPGAHFATFPPKLVEPCIKAGCPDKVCAECGAPWERVTVRTPNPSKGKNVGYDMTGGTAKTSNPQTSAGMHRNGANVAASAPVTVGWEPTCGCMEPNLSDPRYGDESIPDWDHPRPAPVPGTVLDPFAGTGTVGMVAAKLSRRAVLIDLNADYLRQCLIRNAQTPLGLEVPA